MSAFGVASPEEAMAIAKQMGLSQEALESIMMPEPKRQNLVDPALMEPVQLTRKQQLGIEPIPPEI